MATAIVSKPSKQLSNKSLNHHPPKRSPSSPPVPPLGQSTNTHYNGTQFSTREQELLHVFRHFDADGDGLISSEELGTYLASVGEAVSNDDVSRVIGEFDSDGDSLLEFADFVRLVEGGKEEAEDDLRRAFEMYEVERGCGFITPHGLQRMLGRLGDAKSFDECVGMIRKFDLDGNGKLDFQEFQRMMH